MSSNMKYTTLPKQQHGVVLVLSLIILSVLTLVAVTGMRTSVTEEKMSGNIRDRELAMQAAESAMREATTVVDAFTAKADLTGLNGLLDISDPEEQYLDYGTWTNAANYTEAPDLGSGTLADIPKRIIKYIGDEDFCTPAAAKGLNEIGGGTNFACPMDIFRVSSQGTGIAPGTTTVVQSYWARPALQMQVDKLVNKVGLTGKLR